MSLSTIRTRSKLFVIILFAVLSFISALGIVLFSNGAEATTPATRISQTSAEQSQNALRVEKASLQKDSPDEQGNIPHVDPTPCTTYTYTAVLTGTTIVPGTTDVGNHCDNCVTPINLPFQYTFYGAQYTSANVSSNGNLQFTTSNTSAHTTCPTSGPEPVAGFGPTIFAHWDDLRTDNAQFQCEGGCGIYTSVSGSAPNRIFNIEWRASDAADPGYANFEIRLYETTPSHFDVVFGRLDTNGGGALVGVQDGSTAYTWYRCNTGGFQNSLVAFSLSGYYGFTTEPGTIVPGDSDIDLHADDGLAVVTMPFAFNFYGGSYMTATVSTNGNLQFVTDDDRSDNVCLPVPALGPAILAHWDDLTTGDEAACSEYPGGCGVFTSTTGVAPNRVFNIEWRAVYFEYDTLLANFEIRLYEGLPSRFDIIIGRLDRFGRDATIGVQDGASAGAYTQYECQTFAPDNNRIAFTFAPGCVPASTPTPTPCASCTPTPSPTCTTGYSFTTEASTIVAGTTDIGNHTDDGATSIVLPFPFQFYQQSYTTAYANSNGTLQFTTNQPRYGNECLPFGDLGAAIVAHWDDLRTDEIGNCTGYPNQTCGIFTSVSGSAPNRIFNIEWRASIAFKNSPVHFEVRLYEGTQSRFDIVLGIIGGGGASATIGVQDGSDDFIEIECNTPGGAPLNTRIAFTYNACNLPTNTPTPSHTPCNPACTPTPLNTPTYTRTYTPTNTPGVRPSATPCPMSFSDVPVGNNAYNAINYLFCSGAISGYNSDCEEGNPCFRPNNATTRAQLSKIIVLALKWSTNTTGGPHFTDVPEENVFYPFVETAVIRGLVSGYDCGGTGEPCDEANRKYFRPSNNVTRAQLSKIIVLAMSWQPSVGGVQHFTDVLPDNVFYPFVETAVSHGIIGGYNCGGPGEQCDEANRNYFRPNDNATRSQISLIVYRALTNP